MERNRQRLVMMAGRPGSGKTTLALELSRALGWPTVDKDTLKSAMLREGVPEEIAGRGSYELMFEVGRDLLVRQQLSVILDSPAGYDVVIQKAEKLAHEAGAELKFILCLADQSLRNERLAGRVALPSQWTADTGAPGDGSDKWRALVPPDTLHLRTDKTIPELVAETIPYLNTASADKE